MTTLKQRVNLSVDSDLYSALQQLSKKREKSVAAISLQLIEKAIELEEDFYFSRKADKRIDKESKKQKLSHSDIWE